MKPKFFFSGMFFFMISCRIIINMFPYYDLGLLSTLFVGIEYLCILLAIVYSLKNPHVGNLNKNNKVLFLIFVVYTVYTWTYNYGFPQLPVDIIQSMPKNQLAMFLSTFTIGCSLLLASRACNFLNYILFAKISVVVILLTLIFYFFKVDYTLYAISRSMRLVDAIDFNEENRIISPLTLNNYVAVAYVCSLICKDYWTKRKNINNIIFFMTTVYFGFVSLVLGERGPILFMFTTTMFFYFAKGKLAGKYFLILSLFSIFILIFSEQIIDILYSFAPDIVNRTINIIEEGGSGRFGSDDAVFVVAINQINDNPFFGTYHRLLTSSWIGNYPHNVILESLMTFGLVFSIPLFWLMWKAIKNAYWSIRLNDHIALFCLLFVHVSSCMLTSSTMFLNHSFWVSLAMALTYKKNNNVTLR